MPRGRLPQRPSTRYPRGNRPFTFRVTRSNSQIQSDGSLGPLQVGMVLVFADGIHMTSISWSSWSTVQWLWVPYLAGPMPLSGCFGSRCHPSWDSQLVPRSQSWSRAADGSMSNLSLRKTDVTGTCQALTYLVKRYGSVVHIVHAGGVWLSHLLPGQSVEPTIGPRMPSSSE